MVRCITYAHSRKRNFDGQGGRIQAAVTVVTIDRVEHRKRPREAELAGEVVILPLYRHRERKGREGKDGNEGSAKGKHGKCEDEDVGKGTRPKGGVSEEGMGNR
jgi:hypothetical protein